MDAQAVEAYLREKLQEVVKVKRVKRTFPGASRETWLVFCETGDGFVLRVDPPEGAGCGDTLATEYAVYERLFRSPVPVAEPLFYADGESFCEGRPHMVRRMVDGTSSVDGLFAPGEEGAERRRRVAYECVDKLAGVHMLDWQAHGFGELLTAPASAGESFANELAVWQRNWREREPVTSPVLEETFAWLAEIMPTDTPRISLVKGNNGLGEEIWRDERIVAMSDWELACLGDGISDLFWSQGTVRLIGFAEVLARYEEVTGQTVSFERLVYANVFALVKQFISSIAYWYRPLHLGLTNKPYALVALSYMAGYEDKFARILGRPLDEVWTIVNGGEKSMYLQLGNNKS